MGGKKCEACQQTKPHTTKHYRIIATTGDRPRIFWSGTCRACEARLKRERQVIHNPLAAMVP